MSFRTRPRPRPRTAFAGALVALALVSASLVAAPTAGAEETPSPVAPDERPVMGEFPPESYALEASTTPPELTAAIQAGLGISPEEYYAQADAAATAVEVVDGLEAAGTEVLASRVEGTELVVTVADADGAAAAEEVGAVAEIGGAPERDDQPVEIPGARLLRDLVGGQGFYTAYTRDGQPYGYFCSTGFNGIDTVTEADRLLTAGHCVIANPDYNGRIFSLEQSSPNQNPSAAGQQVGSPLAASVAFGDGYDTALYATTLSNATNPWNPLPAVGTWSDNQGAVTSGTPQIVRDYSSAVTGQPVCKSGRTSGWTCGTVKAVDVSASVEGAAITSFTSDLCSLKGDSGGSVVSGSYALGVVSYGNFQKSCTESGRLTGSFPIDSSGSDEPDALDVQKTWEPLVEVAPPVSPTLGGGAPLYRGSAVTGTVAGGGVRHTVRLTIDDGPELVLPVVNGAWSAPGTAALGDGTHSFRMATDYTSGIQHSTTVEGTFLVAERPAVSRIGGATRFDVAVQVAAEAFPDTAPVVYVATGFNYPDALSAGPAAVKRGGPLLPVLPDSVPAVVAAEIQSLKPSRVIIVGGTAAVADSVLTTLQELVPDAAIQRLAAPDRYASSQAVVADAFGDDAGTDHAYVATGTNFPDALSAGAAAGSKGEPVVLVNGAEASADAPTVTLLQELGAPSVTVVGGPNGVSDGVLASLAGGVPTAVDRVAGDNRYATSLALNRSVFASAKTVYLATGLNFPDALSGGVLAALRDAPLYVVPGTCVPQGVLADVTALGATEVVLLGGPVALTDAVEQLAPCEF